MKLRQQEKKNNFILRTDCNKRLAGPQVARANLGGPDLQSYIRENYYGRGLRFVLSGEAEKAEADNTHRFNSCFIMHKIEIFSKSKRVVKKLNILHRHKLLNNFIRRL